MQSTVCFILLIVSGLGSTVTEASAQSNLSRADKRRIEKYGASYINALNAGTAESYAEVIQQIFAQATLLEAGEERLVRQIEHLRKELGQMEYHHSEVVAFDHGGTISYALHVYARTRAAKNWKDLQFRLESTPPHKVKELVFVADVAEPVYLPNTAITDRNTLEWLNGYIDRLIGENDLSGSVLIAKGKKPVYERVFGFADAKRRVGVSADTRFNMASGSKMFTAIAVAQLVEQGKLSYSDPLSKYFPDFPDPNFAQKATVHHLLSHTSGVKEYWTKEYEKNWKTILDTKQMLPWVYKVGTAFEPGSRFEYSNSNFILAGLIVERVSGMDYYGFVRKFITEPLGMTMTEFSLREGPVPNLAEPLKKGKDSWEKVELAARGTSAGGCYSTPRDLLKFSRGLVGGTMVPNTAVSLLTGSKTRGVEASADYGYGFEIGNEGNVRSFGHGGIADGVNFEFRYFPGEDLTFVIFSNQNNGAYDDLRKNIIKLITGMR